MATSAKQAPPGRRVQWGTVAFDRVDETASGQLGCKQYTSQGGGEKAGTSFPVPGSSSGKAWQERWCCLSSSVAGPDVHLPDVHLPTFRMDK